MVASAVDWPTEVRWADTLSPSAQAAFTRAAAAVGDAPVTSGALLAAIVLTHDGTSEPEILLRHFGRTREELWQELRERAQDEGPFEPGGAAHLSPFPRPPLTEAAAKVLSGAVNHRTKAHRQGSRSGRRSLRPVLINSPQGPASVPAARYGDVDGAARAWPQ
jgi:hypothetical protein